MILESLIKYFSLNKNEAISFIKTSPNRYKKYSIKKRHGGEREIAEPTKSLKIIQKWALKEYLLPIKPHDSAIAYIKGKNIKNFALLHANNKYLLKIDFKDFFNSIESSDFIEFCHKNLKNLSEEDIELLVKIFFCKDKLSDKMYLSIGSPSSPFISNILMNEFDSIISNFCSENNISYTRYADDLAFSTNIPDILKSIPQKIESICSELSYPKKLEINIDKTVFTSKKHNRTLTGLVISNEGKISIGRDKKRKLRAQAHKASLGLLSSEELEKLKGTLSFLLSVDPTLANYLKNKCNQTLRMRN